MQAEAAVPRPSRAPSPAPDAPPRFGIPVDRWARVAFLGTLVVVTLLGTWLAIGNRLPGHWDAINNLATGRNIAEGRGYVTDVVQQLATPEPLSGPETVRPPGVPYVIGAVFRVFGVSYAAPVLVSLAIVLLTALCVRQVVRETGGTWEADVAATLILLTHRTFELRSLWNNGFLALLTALLVLLAVRQLSGRLAGWRFVVACAAVAAAGFLMKQTFMLGAIPFAVGLIVTDVRQPMSRRIAQAVSFIAIFAALTAPYWLSNLLHFGQALYSPIQGLRLPTRYGILPTDRFHRTVRYDAAPYTYQTIAALIGWRELFARELRHWGSVLWNIIAQNPFVVLPGVIGLAFAKRRDWRLYAALVAVVIPPVFDSSYWIMEPRYLFSVFPVAVVLAWLAFRGYRETVWPTRSVERARRHVRVGAGLLASAALYSALPAARQWRWSLIASRFEGPTWVSAVSALPRDAVIMAATPPEVNWYTRRHVIIAPVGTHDDLERVLAVYAPSYYLDVEPASTTRRVPFQAGELTPIAAGGDWKLWRIESSPTAARSP